MKQYFAKHLPYDGEIHSGGKYWNKQHQCADDIGDAVHVTMLRIGTFKPAKLFLCSRDIQVGDKYLSPRYPGAATKSEYIECERYASEPQEGSFKVIGEISPEAIWVKEGDELDEDDVKLSKHPECPLCGSFGNDGFCPEDIDCQILKARTVAYIKGPCGHFH